MFEFAYAGEGVEVNIDRNTLEANDWRVTVPGELAARLRSADVRDTLARRLVVGGEGWVV